MDQRNRERAVASALLLLATPTVTAAQTANPIEIRFPVSDSVSVIAGPTIRLTYLANEGVALESGRGRVFIDALFGDGLPEYPAVPRPMRDSLERALGDFGGPTVVLTTHPHRDHFDSAAVQRYLRANPEAVAFGPAGTGLRSAIAPADLGWVRVLPLPIRHGATRRMVDHVAWVVTLEGVSALHIGDTGSDPATWPALGLPAGGVDLALLPYWYALDDSRFQAILRVARPREIVLLHTPVPQSGSPEATAEWDVQRRALLERYPRVRIPARPGEAMDVTPR
jgi:L-ascorbate metabolism protein UlaG (beta-lactamase superfamily)